MQEQKALPLDQLHVACSLLSALSQKRTKTMQATALAGDFSA